MVSGMKRGLSEFDLGISKAQLDGLIADVDHEDDDMGLGFQESPTMPASQGRHKSRRVGKGFRCCRACGQTKPEGEFALNQVVDTWCKKALDNIGRMARAQGPDALEFFKDAKADPAKCKKMLDSYGKAYKNWTAGKTSKLVWSIVQYKERAKAESGVMLSGNSQLMWERQAIKFWMSVDGGALSETEAEAKWSALAARVGEPDVIYDKNGPTRKPLRVAVLREDMVYNYNKLAKERELEFQDKPQKKVDAGTIEKYAKRVTSNHQQVGGNHSEAMAKVLPSGSRLEQSLVQGGAGQAFDEANMNIGNIQDLLPEEDDKKKANEAEGSGAESEKEDEPGEEPKPKVRSWFDKDRAINNAQKGLAMQEDKLRKAQSERKTELKALIAAIMALTEEEQSHYRGELKIATVRLQFLEAVGDGVVNGQSLAELIKQFQSTTSGNSPAKAKASPQDPSAASTAAGLVQLGQFPPCQQFASLVTFTQLSLLKDEVLNCESAEDIKAHKKTFNDTKAPINDLLNTCQAWNRMCGGLN